MVNHLPARLQDLKVGVVSSSQTLRHTVRNLCRELDIRKVITYKSTHAALEAIYREQLDLIISHWTVGVVGAGLDLVETIRKDDNLHDVGCIIMSGEIDRNYVAQTVDFEIDEFLPLPFTALTMKDAILSTLTRRKSPSPYEIALNQTKRLVKTREYDRAKMFLLQAVTLDRRPANAYYYIGYLEMVRGSLDEAIKYYDLALKCRPKHLRSLMGKAFVLKERGSSFELMRTLEEILSVYPHHMKSLDLLFALQLKNGETDSALSSLIGLLANRSEFPELNFLIEKYALPITRRSYSQQPDGSSLEKVIPSLKAFAKGRENFSVQFISLLFQLGLKKDADIEYLRHQNEFGSAFEIEFAAAKFLYSTKEYERCVDVSRKLNANFGEHPKTYALITRSFLRLKDQRRAQEAYEIYRNLKRSWSSERPRKIAS